MSIVNIYSKKILQLDYSVWVTMSVCALLSLALLGYKLVNHESCSPELIHINGITANDYDNYDTNQPLTFSYGILKGDQVAWDFGDRNGDSKQGSVVTYQFALAGNYQVKAIIRSNSTTCEKMVMIKIRPKPAITRPMVTLEITGETYAVEKDLKIYYCNDVANTYLWRLLETEDAQAQNTPTAKFSFPAPGDYTIELMLDNNPARTATKSIIVINKLEIPEQGKQQNIPKLFEDPRPPVLVKPPVGPQPAVASDPKPAAELPDKKKKEVLPETFKTELGEVIDLKKQPEELIEKYLMYGASTKVKIINTDKPLTGFLEFCYQMRSSNKYTIKSVVGFDKDPTGGITVINVILDKKGFINRVLHNKKKSGL